MSRSDSLLRPIRDETGIAAGVDGFSWLSIETFRLHALAGRAVAGARAAGGRRCGGAGAAVGGAAAPGPSRTGGGPPTGRRGRGGHRQWGVTRSPGVRCWRCSAPRR